MKDASKHPLLDMFPELLNGVEYVKLGEVTSMKRGTSATKNAMQAGTIPVISGGRQPAFYCNQSNRDGETITVAGSGAGAGYVQYWDEPIFVCDAFSIKGSDNITTKFIYYFLASIQEQIYSTKKGGGVPHVHISSIDKFEIPLPPLPVQEAIVNILDRFAVYAAELQAELQARQQQYNYYRDTLLSFEGREDVEWITIDQLFHRKNGYTPSKNNNDYWTGGTIPWFRMEDIRANGRVLTDSIQKIHHSAVKKNGLIKAGSIIVATSATIGEHALVKVDCLTNQRFTCLTVKDEYTHRVDTMFLFYYMFKVGEWCKTHTVQGNFPGVDMSQFPNVLIPLPDIDEQRKIASILDHFDTLTNDLSQGLPAEIEARQQQYEYYRDKLLTFKRKEE